MKKTFTIVTVLILIMIGCSSHEQLPSTADAFDHSRRNLQNYATPELFTIMGNLGMRFNYGNSPPNIEGTFLASRLKLLASNIAGDIPNSFFSDTNLKFENFDRTGSGIELSYATTNGSEFSRQNNGIISGNGNRFTIVAKQTITEDDLTAESIIAVSGKLTPNGITDFQFGLFMLDNHGSTEFIGNNQGRIFYDSDNLAQRQ